MDKFIPAFLSTQLAAFKDNLSIPGRICELRSFSYDNGIRPDYTQDLHRQLYYLRFASAYIIEYFLAYKYIFGSGKITPQNNIAVLSIGCGAMLDLIGFEFARRYTLGFESSIPHYYGVDLIDWQCPEAKIIDSSVFLNKGIEHVLPASDLPYRLDILFFPKSVSEIPQECLNSFIDSLDGNDLNSRVCIVNSRRGSSKTDRIKVTAFSKAIARKCGYKIVTQEYINFSGDSERYLSTFCPGSYEYDKDLGSWLNQLVNKYCACARCEDEMKQQCCGIINRWPTLKAKNVSPEIYYLEKI